MTTPLPPPRVARFEQLAYGLFLHWGLYSQMGQGEWIMYRLGLPPEKYNHLMETFTAADFDARGWARMARRAGMRYITLTTRHHEGFSLYDTRGLSTLDAPHSPAGRDLVAEFVEGCRAEDIVPFFYHTTLDWQWDSAKCLEDRFNEYLDYLHASVEVLCTHYGPIGGLWFDGNWSRPQADWKEDRLYRMIHRLQPEAMIINNTGLDAQGATGHPEIDSVTFEQGLPKPLNREGHPRYVSGEMCQTMNKHWGLGANDFCYQSPAQLIQNLAVCRGAGANYLLNVGPTAQGGIPAYERAALERAGDWARLHARPLYEGKPVACTCEGRDCILQVGEELYYVVFDLGSAGLEHVSVGSGGVGPRTIQGLAHPVTAASWLDTGEELAVSREEDRLTITCTGYPYGTDLVVRIAQLHTA